MKQSHLAATAEVCRQALQQGHLVKRGKHWMFGRRLFRPRTVNALIDAGEAVQVGECVVRWSPEAANDDPA